MAFGKFKIFETEEDDKLDNTEEYYSTGSDNSNKSGKMILVEPRAYSESQEIADHLKARNSVVVNFKRVTDFLSGTLYAINGDLQKIGDGIYLCTPKNIDVQGKITEENESQEDYME